MFMRWYWKVLGGHVHVRVFVGRSLAGTMQKAGDLCFDHGIQWDLIKHNQEMIGTEFREDDA